MRLNFTVFGRVAILSFFATTVSGVALASDRGSMEDQLACTPDVYRFCSSFVPNEDAIVACLKKNLQALSPACNRVFTRPAMPEAAKGGDDD